MNTKRVFSVLLASAISLSLTSCGGSSSSTSAASGSAKSDSPSVSSSTASASQSAASTGADGVTTAVFAYDQAYYPYDYTTTDGGADGYEVAVLKAVDELLPQYSFEYVGTTNDDLLLGVESGKYNGGVKGVWWTAAREETYLFPKNYIGASITGITFRTEQADEITDLESFAQVSGLLAPLSPNNAQYTIVENYNKNHPDNQVDLIASDTWTSAEAYAWVLEGRYDAKFDIQTNYEANIVAEDGQYHEYADVLSYVPYEAIPTWVLFNRDQQDLADAFDEAFEQLEADGTIDQLQQQYFGYSLFDLVPAGYQRGDEL
jgi:L-cystine transport system substrate-binding protein